MTTGSYLTEMSIFQSISIRDQLIKMLSMIIQHYSQESKDGDIEFSKVMTKIHSLSNLTYLMQMQKLLLNSFMQVLYKEIKDSSLFSLLFQVLLQNFYNSKIQVIYLIKQQLELVSMVQWPGLEKDQEVDLEVELLIDPNRQHQLQHWLDLDKEVYLQKEHHR